MFIVRVLEKFHKRSLSTYTISKNVQFIIPASGTDPSTQRLTGTDPEQDVWAPYKHSRREGPGGS